MKLATQEGESVGTEDRENIVTAKFEEEEIGLLISSPEFV